MKVIFVGFDVKKENSVMYKKIIKQSNITTIYLGNQLIKAIDKGCDFVSIRFIRDNEEEVK